MKLTVAAKLAFTALVIGAIFWLGSIYTRAFLANELFSTETLTVRENLPVGARQELFLLLAKSSIAILAWYAVVFVSGTLFLIASRMRFKEHGWLLMSSILFYIFLPVEIYTGLIDLKFINAVFNGASPEISQALFVKHFTALAGAPIVGLLSYFTIVILAIWQPLKKSGHSSIGRGINV
ncbi:MAG: hypothetical protein ACP5JH_07070 [Bacteroidota bacterium]